MSYEHRRPKEMTSMYLGRVLEDYLGLPEMARRAREGHFDDYFCPPEVDDGSNMIRLVAELLGRSQSLTRWSPQWKRVQEVITDVKQGEFDGTREEAQRWAASKGGIDALREVLRRKEE